VQCNTRQGSACRDGWLHEVKFDGYRVQAHKVGSRVIMYSHNGHDFSDRFPSIAHDLPAKAAVLDGEVLASDAGGRPNFARLHVRWTRPGHYPPMGVRSICVQWP
jgi:bifunctional non-homologous end joining protein LigD